MSTLITEFPFVLRLGYADENGDLHKEGAMRLATAADEIMPQGQENQSYLSIIILSRVVTRLGTLPMITPRVIEGLFAADFAMLQDMYDRTNERGRNTVDELSRGDR